MKRNILNVVLICFVIVRKTAAGDQDQQVSMQKSSTDHHNQVFCDALPQLNVYSALIQISKDQSVNEICLHELDLIQDGFLAKRAWAMKVIDATGGKPSGFLLGQNFWLGSRDTCNAVRRPIKQEMSDRFDRSTMKYGILNETAPFDVHFKIANLNIKTPWQVDWKLFGPEKTIIWGLCLPISCSNWEIAKIMKIYIKSDQFLERKVLEINATLAFVKDLDFNWDFFEFTSVRILIGILVFSFFMILVAMCLRIKSIDSKGCESNSIENSVHPMRAFIQCYDIKENSKRIFHKSNTNTEISAICAIRAINAYLIIPLHFVFFTLNACINRTRIFSYFIKPIICWIYIIVEPFFIISGFLLTYNFLRNERQRALIKDAPLKDIPMLFFKRLFHRWLRLAPSYYVVVVLDTVLHALFYEISLHTLPNRDDELMTSVWYILQHIFFFNNFKSIHDSTVKWTWSLACELQFFIIGTILLFIYVRSSRGGKVLFIIVVLSSVMTYFYNGISTSFTWEYDVAFNVLLEMYFHTMIRILSYLVGMLGAWYIVEKPQSSYPMVECWLGNLSFVLFGVLLLPLIDTRNGHSVMPTVELILIRLFISLWICWLILADIKGRSIWLSSILKSSVFQPIARLSYGIYLIHPIVIMLVINLTDMGLLLDWTIIIIGSAGTILLATLAALFHSTVFEMPYCNLSSRLFQQNR